MHIRTVHAKSMPLLPVLAEQVCFTGNSPASLRNFRHVANKNIFFRELSISKQMSLFITKGVDASTKQLNLLPYYIRPVKINACLSLIMVPLHCRQ